MQRVFLSALYLGWFGGFGIALALMIVEANKALGHIAGIPLGLCLSLCFGALAALWGRETIRLWTR